MSEERRAKLKSLLMQQMVRLHDKSGFSKNEFPLQFVSARLDALLKSNTVKDSDIRDLAIEARNFASEKAAMQQKKDAVNLKSRTGNGEGSVVSEAGSQKSSRPGSAAAHGSKLRHNLTSKVDLWAQLVQEDVVQYDKEQMQMRAEARKRMHDQREHLDVQVHNILENKVTSVEQEKMFAVQQARQLEQWVQDTKKADAAKREQLELEKRIRDEQMKALTDRKVKEGEVRRKEDTQVLHKIQADIQHDIDVQLQKKEEAKVEMKRFSEFNALQKQAKLKKQMEEVEVDKKHQKLYLQKLEKLEQEREESLRKLYERQTKHVVMATKMTAGMNERSKQDELRAAAEQDRIRNREAATELKKREKLEEEKKVLQQFLAMQVRDKDRQRDAERVLIEADRQVVQREIEEAEEKEKSRKAALRHKESVYRRQVEAQMKDRHDDTMRGMTYQEHKLNTKLLEKLE